MNEQVATTSGGGDRTDQPVAGASSYRNSHIAEGTAVDYDRDFHDPRTAKGQNWIVERRIVDAAIRRHARRRSRALDFACGTGRILQLLETYAMHTVGIDISSDMAQTARSRCRRSKVLVADLTRDPDLLPEPFDIVTAFRFFLNAEPELRRSALRAVRASVSEHGVLIANFHLNPMSARGLYLRARWLGRRRTSMLTPRQATELIEGQGFDVVDVIGYEFLPFRRDGARLMLPRVRVMIERRLLGRAKLNAIAGSFVVVARPAPESGNR